MTDSPNPNTDPLTPDPRDVGTDDAGLETDPVPVHPIDPVDPNDPLDGGEPLAPKKNFGVTLKYPATAAEVEAGCSATFLADGDLTLPIQQLGGSFQFKATAVQGVDHPFVISVKPVNGVLSTALMFLVQVPVSKTSKVQIGLAYGRVIKKP